TADVVIVHAETNARFNSSPFVDLVPAFQCNGAEVNIARVDEGVVHTRVEVGEGHGACGSEQRCSNEGFEGLHVLILINVIGFNAWFVTRKTPQQALTAS